MNSPDKLLWYDLKEMECSSPGAHSRSDTYDSLLEVIISKQQSAAISENDYRTSHIEQTEQLAHDEIQYVPVFGYGKLVAELQRDVLAEKILQLRHRLEQIELRLNGLETRVSFLLKTHPSSELLSSRTLSRESNMTNLNEQPSLPAILFWTMWPVILLNVLNKLNITATHPS